jgi:hypothetical protein
VENLSVMQGLEAFNDLNKNSPDLFLLDVSLFLLVPCNFLKQVPVVSVLHDNTELIIWQGTYQRD